MEYKIVTYELKDEPGTWIAMVDDFTIDDTIPMDVSYGTSSKEVESKLKKLLKSKYK